MAAANAPRPAHLEPVAREFFHTPESKPNSGSFGRIAARGIRGI
jgi:hypothetical protein